jgi:hypothetical protein
MIRIAPLAPLIALAIGGEAASAGSPPLTGDDRVLLKTYAEATWRSIDKATKDNVLPSDGLWRSGEAWTTASYTSPTDIAAYLWSTIAAEGLGFITHDEAGKRLMTMLASVERLERSHGFFYNWYDPKTGERLRHWPGGGPVRGFLSTVDNAWLAVALMMVGQNRPELKVATERLLEPMKFSFFYDPLDASDPVTHPGLLRGGFFPDGGGVFADYHYGTLNTEPRIASYVGIARGDLPRDHYYRMHRAAQEPTAPMRTYDKVPVVESFQPYKGARLLPSWDGTMFEALMVPLFVPEATWAPMSWGTNHRLYAKAQIEYCLNDAKLGYWGISASTDTKGGYRAFGIAPLALNPTAGRDEHGEPTRVVTPHASFLALAFTPRESVDNLKKLTACFPSVYTPYGFLDAVDVGTGSVSEGMLVLDQGMILAAISNALGHDAMQQAFAGSVEEKVKPLMVAEQFEVGPSSILASRRLMVADTPATAATPADGGSVADSELALAQEMKPRLRRASGGGMTPLPGRDEQFGVLASPRSSSRRKALKPAERRRPAG